MTEITSIWAGDRIQEYDGYRGKPIWKKKENASTYYDVKTDTQCNIPMKTVEELKKELGID